MKLLSKINYKRLVIYVLLAFAVFIIGSWPVSAFEQVLPKESIDIYDRDGNLTTYYGYSIPNRPNNLTGGLQNYVSIGVINQDKSRAYSESLTFTKNPTVNGISKEESWFTDWIQSNWKREDSKIRNYLTLSFHPGESAGSVETLGDGYKIDYDSYYSYTFYLEVEALGDDFSIQPNLTGRKILYPMFDSYNSPDSNNVLQSHRLSCDQVAPGNYNGLTNGSCNLKISVVEQSEIHALIKYEVIFKPMYQNIGYNQFNSNGFLYCNNGCTQYVNNSPFSAFSNNGGFFTYSAFYGNTFHGFQGMIGTVNTSTLGQGTNDQTYTEYPRYRFRVSQPINITMYNTESSLYCQDNCWTQNDTNNNNVVEEGVQNSNELIDNLFGFRFFNDFGTFNIITSVFDELRSILSNNYNDACYSYNINILGSDIPIMCGNTFWNRSDIELFKNLWDMFWLGLIGFWIGRSVYLKLLSLVDIENGVVIDAKEVTRL